MKHSTLVQAGYKWLLSIGCAFAFKELVTVSKETPDVIGFKGNNSYMLECKTSRSDFFADKKKSFRKYPAEGMGRFRFYVCPKNMLKVEDLPTNWGLIYVNGNGKAEIQHNPYCKSLTGNIFKGGFYKRNKENEMRMMYSALRRLHILKKIDRIYEVKGYK